MALSGIASKTLSSAIMSIRKQTDQLQVQLATGRKSTLYSGLGSRKDVSMQMRQEISRIEGFSSTISDVRLRLNVMNTVLDDLSSLGREAKSAVFNNPDLDIIDGDKTSGQKKAGLMLDQALSMLNQDVTGRNLFSGNAGTQRATVDLKTLMEGTVAQAGFETVRDERNRADLGTNAMGRLTTSVSTTNVTLARDGDHSFGMQIAGIAQSGSSLTISGPAGSPPSATLSFSSQPSAGEQVELTFNLPDGAQAKVVLTASNTTPLAENEFSIGAASTDTAANFKTALDSALTRTAQTDLLPASSMTAGDDFFANPPQRVVGTPETATALTDGTSSDTVIWYTGEDNGSSARDSVKALIDKNMTVSYGARANEPGIKNLIKSLAVFSSESFANTEVEQDRYTNLVSKFSSAITAAVDGNTSGIRGIQVELAHTNSVINSVDEQNIFRKGLLEEMRDDTENVQIEEVGMKLIQAQTRLQASYSVTAQLAQLSLINYI